MSQPMRGQDGHLVFPIGPKTQTWKRTLRYCFLSSFLEFRSAVSEEKSKMRKVNDGWTDDGQRVITIVHLSFRLGCTKNCITLRIKYS